MLWKVLFWKQVLAHPREIPTPALSRLSISTEAFKGWTGSINPLLWTFRVLTAWHGRVSIPLSHGCSHLASLHLQVIISEHSKAVTQLPFTSTEQPLHTAAGLPLYDSPAEEGRITEQRQACLLAFLLSPPNGNSSPRGFPYMVSATPLQILLPPPNPIPPF